MAISKTTLAAIQKTGAFAHNLKLALQAETKKYSDQLSKALSSNPHGNAFELLDGPAISNWKGVGALSKMVDAIESELMTAFKFASDLVTGAQPAVEKAKAPKAAVSKVKAAVVKKATPKAQAPIVRGSGNAEKLLAKLVATISSDEFTVLKQTELAKTLSIPLGSMTAALKKLTATGDLVLGKDGGYKLGKKKAAAAPAAKAAVAAVKPVKAAPKAAATKTGAKKKLAAVVKDVVAKAAPVVRSPKPVKPVVATAKAVVVKAAAKKTVAKKTVPATKPVVIAAMPTEAIKSEPTVEIVA